MFNVSCMRSGNKNITRCEYDVMIIVRAEGRCRRTEKDVHSCALVNPQEVVQIVSERAKPVACISPVLPAVVPGQTWVNPLFVVLVWWRRRVYVCVANQNCVSMVSQREPKSNTRDPKLKKH